MQKNVEFWKGYCRAFLVEKAVESVHNFLYILVENEKYKFMQSANFLKNGTFGRKKLKRKDGCRFSSTDSGESILTWPCKNTIIPGKGGRLDAENREKYEGNAIFGPDGSLYRGK